jgi:hypothetical protein
MNITKKLKEGIESRDWNAIIEVYSSLSDEPLSLHDDNEKEYEEPSYDDANRELQEIAVKIKNDEYIFKPNSAPRVLVDEDGKTMCRSERFDKSKTKINTFIDDGTIATEDRKFDKVIAKKTAARDRPQYKQIKTVCSRCNRDSYAESAALAKYHICRTCTERISRGS